MRKHHYYLIACLASYGVASYFMFFNHHPDAWVGVIAFSMAAMPLGILAVRSFFDTAVEDAIANADIPAKIQRAMDAVNWSELFDGMNDKIRERLRAAGDHEGLRILEHAILKELATPPDAKSHVNSKREVIRDVCLSIRPLSEGENEYTLSDGTICRAFIGDGREAWKIKFNTGNEDQFIVIGSVIMSALFTD